ncbi:MAG TPA: DUF4252 domain-containing protein [Blastocatellia bacterium]
MTNKRFLGLLLCFVCGLLVSSFAFPLTGAAQQEKLRLDHLHQLANRATEVVEVSLDQTALKALTKLTALSEGSNRDREKLSGLTSRLRGVYVRGYEFEREGEYSPNDIEAVRLQLRAPGWTRIVQVGGRNNSYDEIYLKQGNDEVDAYAVISTAPKNVCVINVIGPMRVDDIRLLDREYGISNCGRHGNRRKSR